MPNWCSVGINITGDKDSLKQIKEILDYCRDNKKFVFEYLIGKRFDGTGYEYETGGWYQHNLDRFSTKWDVRVDDDNDNGNSYEADEEGIFLNLTTAWSPPTNFCQTLSDIYPEINVWMQFEEGGCDFFGQEEFYAGKMTRQEIYSYRAGAYKWEPEIFWSEVESDLESMLEDVDDIDEFSVEDYLEEAGFDYLTEDDKKTIQTLLDSQRAYVKGNGTLSERLEKFKTEKGL